MAFGSASRRTRIIDELNAVSEVVGTARGPIEIARRGEAPYVVILHGTPQGHNASVLGEPFEAAGLGTVTPSRPGYLRTPLDTGRTFEEQADAVAAMLDALAIDSVAAYAISGGGPTGIELAARHPDRVRALVLEVAISHTYKPQISDLAVRLFTSRIVMWLQAQVLRRFPRLAVRQVVQTESTLDAADRSRATADILATPAKLDYLRSFVLNMPPLDLLRTGFQNDLAQFRTIERLPLDRVRCPTLVVHGTHDRDVPFSHGENSAREIPGAVFHRVEKGWHLLAMSDEAYARAEVDFLREHLVPPPPADGDADDESPPAAAGAGDAPEPPALTHPDVPNGATSADSGAPHQTASGDSEERAPAAGPD